MSIIAIKNRKLAWDSQITASGGFKFGCMSDKVKRFRFGRRTYYAGGCGSLSTIQSFYRFLENFDAEEFDDWLASPKYNQGSNSSVFIYVPDHNHLLEFADRGLPVQLNLAENNYAVGVGSEYAHGFMDAGKSAYEAVVMVTERFDSCSKPVHRAAWRKSK